MFARRFRSPSARRGGLVRYVAAWLLAGAVVTAVALLLSHRTTHHHTRVPSGAAPPVREVQLADAMRKSGCTVVHGAAPRRDEVAAATPARPGVHTAPLAPPDRSLALRQGLAVVEYRLDLPAETVRRLVAVQRSMPAGTVLAPAAELRSSQVRVSTYGRQLRCPTADVAALDAVQLFRGRYLGSGPG